MPVSRPRVRHVGVLTGTTVTLVAAAVLLVRPWGGPAHADSAKRAPSPKTEPRTTPATERTPSPPAASPGGCPADMTAAGPVCIDRYEAHLAVRHGDGSLSPHPPHARPTGATFVARSTAGVRPQSYISRVEAALACENAGKRLCSASEWYFACSGPDKRAYPYGERFESGRCNTGKPHLLSIRHGKDPRGWKYDEHFNDPLLCQAPGFLAPTGEHSGCVTAEGAYDLVGNLHEWVSDRVDLTLADKVPLTDGIRKRLRSNTGKGVFMGGFFSTTSEHGQGCAFVTAAHEPGYHDYSTGFRCCKGG